jgi:hypothetical protein
VEEGNERAFKLGSTTSIYGGGRERLPDDGLANVGGNEEIDARAKTVAFLEQLIEENDDKGSNDELDDQEEADTCAEVTRLAIETGQDVDGGLSERDNECEDCKDI